MNGKMKIKTLVSSREGLRMTAMMPPEEYALYCKYLKEGMESVKAALKAHENSEKKKYEKE